jgi:NAD(P)H-hydrate epimerase
LANPGGPRILTPHPGEFRRLVGTDLSLDESHDRARRLAEEFGVIVVLKGHQSLVTDGSQSYQNETGNPGMATGGAGDVLTGVIAALLGQGFTPLDAARLGVHVHGLAGDLACDDLGEVSLVASDILEYLPESFQELE